MDRQYTRIQTRLTADNADNVNSPNVAISDIRGIRGKKMTVVSCSSRILLCISLLVVSCLSACNRTSSQVATGPTSGKPWFQEVTRQSQLAFRHDPGPTASYFMPPAPDDQVQRTS